MFDNMRRAARERLENQNPVAIARNAGVTFDGKAFRFPALGKEVSVFWPQLAVEPETPGWQELTILHYLDMADGTLPSGNQITFSQHKDGMVRGRGFDRDVERITETVLGKLSPEELKHRWRKIGGVMEPSNADLCFRFDYLPRYPVWLKLWFADEEFPASGRMLLDRSAEHYLTIEDTVTVGTLILESLLNM